MTAMTAVHADTATLTERIKCVPRPKARDEMTDEEFYAMLAQSMEEAQQGKVTPAWEVFAELKGELAAYGV